MTPEAQLHSTAARVETSKAALWTGRILSGIAAFFLLIDAGMKLAEAAPAMKGSIELGYPPSTIFGIGVVLFLCLVLYLVPRTAVLGAVLLTGYLGGAVATHVRVGNPLFTHMLSPIYVAAFIWGGLWLRDERLRTVLAPRSTK